MIVMIIIVVLEVIAGLLAFAFWPEVIVILLLIFGGLLQCECISRVFGASDVYKVFITT